MATKRLKTTMISVTYDVAVHGGVKNTAIKIGDLPANALITRGYLVTDTDFVGNTTTISVGYTGAATAFLGATTATTMDQNEPLVLLPGVPALGSDAGTLTTGTVATLQAAELASLIYLTASKEILVTLSNDNNLTAGKFTAVLEYVIL